MPLHLLGKKSWNVYNPANIARVKADEAAAAAREAADEQRMQELDAERRAAILRGITPPPLPVEDAKRDEREHRKPVRDRDGDDRKRRRLAGEDDTDRDIRLAMSVTGPRDDENAAVLKLRKPTSDAPVTDHAGNINLFPIDLKEAMKREKNAEAEKEKKKKERALEDQYTMRFSNAAGKDGLEQPWYASSASRKEDAPEDAMILYPDLENKDIWGNEDLRRKDREQARVATNDPLAFMNRAQAQLKRVREDRKKWVAERGQELRDLRAVEEREHRRDRHGKRKKRAEEDQYGSSSHRHGEDEENHSRHRYRHRSRSHSRDRKHDHKLSHRHEKRRSRSRSRDRSRDRRRDSATRHKRRHPSRSRERH